MDFAKKDGKVTSNLSSALIANQFYSIIKGQIFFPVILGLSDASSENTDLAKSTAKDFL